MQLNLDELYVSITGTEHYYGKKQLKIGSNVKLIKEPENDWDDYAIVVRKPYVGTLGYVANKEYTTAEGCVMAKDIYQLLPDECCATIKFRTQQKIIAVVHPKKTLVAKYDESLVDINPNNV